MQFPVLRETPDNSGTFLATGQVFECDPAEALSKVNDLVTETGSRHALQVFDALRKPPAAKAEPADTSDVVVVPAPAAAPAAPASAGTEA